MGHGLINMTEIKVLVEGKHKKVKGGFLIGSTSTLIKTNKKIVVDPGSFVNEDKIIKALKKEGLTPKDINIVMLTHLHIDHTTNLHLFKNAKVILKFVGKDYPGQIHTIKKGLLQRFELEDGKEIAKDVEIILTPGHTLDMVSVVVGTPDGKVVITGDAIRLPEFADLKNKELSFITANMKEYNKSRKKILEIADYIIPGHGKIFKVDK